MKKNIFFKLNFTDMSHNEKSPYFSPKLIQQIQFSYTK